VKQRTGSYAALTGLLLVAAASPIHATDSGQACHLPPGWLTTTDLPEGSDVIECDAIARIVQVGDVSLPVPRPGTGISIEKLYPDYSESAAITVDSSGAIEYEGPGGTTGAEQN